MTVTFPFTQKSSPSCDLVYFVVQAFKRSPSEYKHKPGRFRDNRR